MKIKNLGKSGKRSIIKCKECEEEYSALDIKIREGKEKFCSNGCYNQYRKNNKKDPKKLNILYQKKFKYGLNEEQYTILINDAQGKCKICKKVSNRLVVDHCHQSGMVRGLLCDRCNMGLGHFNDSIDILKNCIEYLENMNSRFA